MTSTLCPCGSKRVFEKCCGRFLEGGENARTPEQLMRSRYTAHCLGTYGEYLVRTWLAATELGLTAASFAEHKVDWQKLEVLKSSQRGDLGMVEFKAYYLDKEVHDQENRDLKIHHERSSFKRVKGLWYYVEAL